MKRLTILVTSIFLLPVCSIAGDGVTHKTERDLSRAAEKTAERYYEAINNNSENNLDEIPEKYWDKLIKELNPIKLYMHRVNIVIVLTIDGQVETGRYVYQPLSSFIPVDRTDGFKFTYIEDGTYKYIRHID